MKLNKNWGSYLPVLIQLVEKTEGAILELGMGIYSSPYLHYCCKITRRELISYESDPYWFKLSRSYEDDFHKVMFIEDWKDLTIDKKYDIALVDMKPGEARKDAIKVLANHAKFIIGHDAQDKVDYAYGYKEIYPLFKYKYLYTDSYPHSVILSNFVDVTKLNLGKGEIIK